LDAGLQIGANKHPELLGAAVDLVANIFSSGLAQKVRHEKLSRILGVYDKYQGVPALGEGLVRHLGSLFLAGSPFPSSDNLEQWAASWDQAAEGVDEFRLPLRLLRTGIDFLIAGGKDEGILLRLTSAEREILKQAFGLAEGS
jgi:hypothetical protein